MEFKDRLKNYRLELGVKNKIEMASRLEIARTLYSMLENGTRTPSKDVLEKLFIMSDKTEEYWLFGIEDYDEYIEKRGDFKSMRDTIDQLYEIGMFENEGEYTDAEKEVLLAAALADTSHILEKKRNKKQNL